MTRHSSYKTISGEGNSVDEEVVSTWVSALLAVTARYDPQNVFNAGSSTKVYIQFLSCLGCCNMLTTFRGISAVTRRVQMAAEETT